MISFYYKKVKALDKHCPATIGKEFSLKFLLDTKVENSDFWNISYLGLCCKWVPPKYQFKEGEWVFWDTKIFRKYKTKGSGPS